MPVQVDEEIRRLEDLKYWNALPKAARREPSAASVELEICERMNEAGFLAAYETLQSDGIRSMMDALAQDEGLEGVEGHLLEPAPGRGRLLITVGDAFKDFTEHKGFLITVLPATAEELQQAQDQYEASIKEAVES